MPDRLDATDGIGWKRRAVDAARVSLKKGANTPTRTRPIVDAHGIPLAVNQPRRPSVHYERRADIQLPFLRLAVTIVCFRFLKQTFR